MGVGCPCRADTEGPGGGGDGGRGGRSAGARRQNVAIRPCFAASELSNLAFPASLPHELH